jgi:hypothetical protein
MENSKFAPSAERAGLQKNNESHETIPSATTLLERLGTTLDENQKNQLDNFARTAIETWIIDQVVKGRLPETTLEAMGDIGKKVKIFKEVGPFLSGVFRTSTDFDAFCLDYFGDTRKNFVAGTNTTQRYLALIINNSWTDILQAIRQNDPQNFTRKLPLLPPHLQK